MKKLLFACIIGATTIAPAHAEGPYVGLGLHAYDKGQSASGTEAALKLFGGYDFNDTWGIEVGIPGLPNYAAHDINGVPMGTAKGDSLYVAAKATMAINDKWSLVTKLGVAHTRLKTGGMDSDRYSSSGLYSGIGIKYALTEKVAVTLEVERYGSQPKHIYGGAKRESASLNVSYSF